MPKGGKHAKKMSGTMKRNLHPAVMNFVTSTSTMPTRAANAMA
jgi:hypothetical protein